MASNGLINGVRRALSSPKDQHGGRFLERVSVATVSESTARATFTLRTPASCILKSVRSDSPYAFSSSCVLSPCAPPAMSACLSLWQTAQGSLHPILTTDSY
ncbi:MAG: hypothetical protein U0J70_09375, partial [Atopobiaceae bacterium]|nr:hypothetical protein [Atopobiaceae bacterium]